MFTFTPHTPIYNPTKNAQKVAKFTRLALGRVLVSQLSKQSINKRTAFLGK